MEDSSSELSQKKCANYRGKGGQLKSQPRIYPQYNHQGDGGMNIDKPLPGEASASCPQDAKWEIQDKH